MCVLWGNNDANIDEFYIDGYDINNSGDLVKIDKLPIKRIKSLYSEKYYNKKDLFSDYSNDGILINTNGTERLVLPNAKKRVQPMYSDDMIGYMVVDSSGFDNPDTHSSLLVAARYNGSGFFLHRDNYLEKLPMFAASRYVTYNTQWTEKGRIMKSADGAEKFFGSIKSKEMESFLLKCLFFTCFEMQNHMHSLYGRDGRYYRNELCLDTSKGETVASNDLQKMIPNQNEKKILKAWERVLDCAKRTDEYDDNLTYGVHQIYTDLNKTYKDSFGKKQPKYPDLNGALNSLKKLIKDYYNKEIVPTLFEYEFLK